MPARRRATAMPMPAKPAPMRMAASGSSGVAPGAAGWERWRAWAVSCSSVLAPMLRPAGESSMARGDSCFSIRATSDRFRVSPHALLGVHEKSGERPPAGGFRRGARLAPAQLLAGTRLSPERLADPNRA